MFAMRKYLFRVSGATWLFLIGGMVQAPASANTSSLCSSRRMEIELAISTKDFHAAIRSKGYYETDFTQCYVPTDYYYVGQSHKTGESIVLANATDSMENGISIFRVKKDSYIYQIYLSDRATRRLSISSSLA